MPAMARQYTGAGLGAAGNMAASFQGPPQPVSGGRLSVGLEWTGNPTGTLAIECSFNGKTWRAVPGASAEFTANGNAQPAGSPGGAVLNFVGLPGTLWRLTYARTSGSGTLTSYWRSE